MSEPLNPGAHPDPDSLNAFLEGALPEHERLECLTHFAQCPRCREVVFLAQEPPPATVAPKPIPSWRRWFTPVAVLSGAAACVLVVAVSLYPRHTPVAPTRELVASANPENLLPSPPPTVSQQKAAAKPRVEPAESEAKIKPPARKNSSTVAQASPVSPSSPGPLPLMARSAAQPSPPMPTPPPPRSEEARIRPDLSRDAAAPRASVSVPPAGLGVVHTQPSAAPAASPLRLSIKHDGSPVDGRSEIAGSVTDPAGAAIPGATVTLDQLTGAPTGNARADASGKFKISAIPAGKYELRIAAPGFLSASGQIELQAQDVATVAPVLSVGTLSETVEVSAAAGTVLATAPRPQDSKADEERMASASKIGILPSAANGAIPPDAHRLPSKHPIVTATASGQLLLAADSAGALFYSRNAGKSWKAVKSIWPGNVVRLATLAPTPTSRDAFQLTTESGSVWLSRDGLHWRQAPPQR
jgi:hypothetical protein